MGYPFVKSLNDSCNLFHLQNCLYHFQTKANLIEAHAELASKSHYHWMTSMLPTIWKVIFIFEFAENVTQSLLYSNRFGIWKHCVFLFFPFFYSIHNSDSDSERSPIISNVLLMFCKTMQMDEWVLTSGCCLFTASRMIFRSWPRLSCEMFALFLIELFRKNSGGTTRVEIG